MFKETLRMFAILLMIIIIIMDDFPFYSKLKNPSTQLFLGIFVITAIYYDTTLGFILGLVLMLIYYEIYNKIKKSIPTSQYKIEHYTRPETNTIQSSEQPDTLGQPDVSDTPKINTKNGIMQLNYISDEHLIAAQNNIFDPENYATEVKGIEKGYNDESVYGAQGLDSDKVNVRGYDNDDVFKTFGS